MNTTALTLSLYRAQVDAYAAKVSFFAEQVRLEMLFGSQAIAPPCKCASCGSTDFIRHRGRSICTYCRQPPEVKPEAFNWSGEI